MLVSSSTLYSCLIQDLGASPHFTLQKVILALLRAAFHVQKVVSFI